MATFSEAVADAIKSAGCAVLAGSDSATAFVNNLIGQDGDFGNIARALRKSVCNNSDDVVNPPPVPGVPFTGGQCPGVAYRIRTRLTTASGASGNCSNVSTGGPFFSNIDVTGPITSVRKEYSGSGECGPINISIVVDHGGGTTVLGPSPTGGGGRIVAQEILTVESVTRLDGLPDDCGNLPPPGPFTSITTTTNITYEDNSQTTINEGVDITIFAPIIGINGQIFAPITVTGNDFSLVGELTFSPEFKVDLFPNGLGNPTQIVDEPLPEPGRDYPEPEPSPDRRVIVGAIVTVTDAAGGRATQIVQGSNPDIFAPRFGNIAFYVNTSKGTAWTNDLPIKSVRTYIPCPVPGGAVDVAGTADSGYQFSIQPVWQYPNQR